MRPVRPATTFSTATPEKTRWTASAVAGKGTLDAIDVAWVSTADGDRETFAVRLVTSLEIAQAGSYVFDVCSDDTARLYVNGSLDVANEGTIGFHIASGAVALTAGTNLTAVTCGVQDLANIVLRC